MEQALIFRLGGELFGLEVGEVQEIFEAARLHYIPRGGGFLGAVNVHGQILPVLDLAAHLGRGGEEPDHRLVVLVSLRLALAVTRVQRIVPLEAEALLPPAQAGWARGVLDHEAGRIQLLDLARLRASLEKTGRGKGEGHGAEGADRG